MNEDTYEYDKVKKHLGHKNFQIVSMYSGYNGDGNRCSFVSVKVGFDMVEITIDNMTGEVEEA